MSSYYAIWNVVTDKFLPHATSELMPALYQDKVTAGRCMRQRLYTEQMRENWHVVPVNLTIPSEGAIVDIIDQMGGDL